MWQRVTYEARGDSASSARAAFAVRARFCTRSRVFNTQKMHARRALRVVRPDGRGAVRFPGSGHAERPAAPDRSPVVPLEQRVAQRGLSPRHHERGPVAVPHDHVVNEQVRGAAAGVVEVRAAFAVIATIEGRVAPEGEADWWRLLAWGARIWGQRMGSEASRLAESERGVWFFWLKRHSICTPHVNRKNELILFSGGGKPILPPNSGAQERGRRPLGVLRGPQDHPAAAQRDDADGPRDARVRGHCLISAPARPGLRRL